MTRTTKLMALAAFVFGVSFASMSVAACNGNCFRACQNAAINRCVQNGGTNCESDVVYAHCYRQCGCIIP